MSRLTYLKANEVKFSRREGALLLDVDIHGQVTHGIHIVRSFPLSHPDEYLSLRDAEQKELGVLEGIAGLDAQSATLVSEELDRRYFTPEITKINSLKNDASMWRFNVETSRGPSDFYVRNWRDNAHELMPGRWQITSVDGGRYEIIDLDKLDDRSQLLIEQLL